ncbi:Uncharacterised protein [Vibrio cholerae]|nr:Uncharacterised protein [Vibrio cholerae]
MSIQTCLKRHHQSNIENRLSHHRQTRPNKMMNFVMPVMLITLRKMKTFRVMDMKSLTIHMMALSQIT